MVNRIRNLKQFGAMRDIGYYLSSNLLRAALPFLTLPFLTLYLSPADYGLWNIYLAFLSLLVPITACGLPMTIGRHYNLVDKAELAKMTFNATICVLVFCIILFAIILAYGTFHNEFMSIPIWVMMVLPLLCFVQNFQYLNKIILRHENRAFLFSCIEVLNAASIRIIGVLAVVFISASWLSLLKVHIATQIFFALVALYLFLKGKRIVFEWDKAKATMMLITGWPLIFHALGGIVMNLSDRLILENMTDVATVGIYSLGANLGVATLIFCNAVNNKWGAWMYKQMKNPTEADKIKIVRYTYIYFLITACVGIGVTIVGIIYMKLFIGEAFQEAIPIIGWIAAGSAVYGMSFLVTHYIIILGETTLLPKITGGAAALNIALTIIMVNMNGAIGAAQATLIAYMVFFVVMWWQNNKHYPMPWISALKFR